MNKPVKYFLIAAASFGVLMIAAIFTITALVDVESYKPKIEQLVTEKTGYPLTLGGEIDLSLFPWIGLSFADLQLGNPEGFSSKTFVNISDFQARLKVLPLLSRNVEISSFVVKRPEIFLEKSPKGVWNWEKLTEGGKVSERSSIPAGSDSSQIPSGEDKKQDGFAIQSLVVEEFSITDGRVQLNDLESKLKREISDFNLQLEDVSLDKPVKLSMAAVLDGKPMSLEGSVGPLGPDLGAGKVNLDLVIRALDTMTVKASGYLEDIKVQKKYKLTVNVDPFSPKELFSKLGLRFPVTTSDPKALEKVGLKANVAGDTTQVMLTDSNIALDDTSIKLDATAKDFSRPDLAFNLDIDSIDVDRYLPPKDQKSTSASGQSKTAGKEAVPQGNETAASGQVKAKEGINYDPLRKLVLKGTMKLGSVKVSGGTLSNLALDVKGKDGLFTINSLGMDLYEGNVAATGTLNVQKNTPVTAANLTLQGVQVGPLLKDFTNKELIEGMLKAEVAVNMQGDNADRIKKSLNGKGDLVFQDGALIGLDLAQMARNIKSGFTLAAQGDRPKTDFAELHAPFTITNGLVSTPETTLRSPFIRVTAMGDANLVNEALNMKVKPSLVGTMKGQGDTEQRAGLSVPVLVGGTFKAPQFRPDLESLVKDRIPSEQELGEMIKTGKVPVEKEQLKEEVEKAKGMLKGLFGK
ncbi:MAG: AsmA family protein [Desulforhopalus sp.]